MFKQVADIQTADMLDLPVPIANFRSTSTKPSEFQKEMLTDLSERADAVRAKLVDSTEDNMLKITNDGRKLALDQRLINPLLPDDETSKVNDCVNRVFQVWEDNKEAKLTQLIFCDLSTPKADGTFNVYDDIRRKLIERGVPEGEIAFIHNAKTDAAKKEVFAKVRQGQIRVLIGSTQKMGAGTNVQDRLLAVHDLDCPWRPSDLEQRAGRIVRQGNKNPEVYIYRYVTENTFDAYLYQLVENKQRFIGQVMTSKSPARSAEDVDETALSYAEIKMLATGNPYIKEKMDLDVQVAKLKMLKAAYLSQRYTLEDWIVKKYPAEKKLYEERIKGYEADIAQYEKNKTVETFDGKEETKFLGITVNGQFYDDKAKAGKAIIDFCGAMKHPEATPLGSYLGFDMSVSYDSFGKEYKLTLKGMLGHTVSLGSDSLGNITRINNALERMSDNLELAREKLSTTETQKLSAEQQLSLPFSKEDELKEKSARLAELDAMLNLDAAPERESVDSETEPEEKDDTPKAVGYER